MFLESALLTINIALFNFAIFEIIFESKKYDFQKFIFRLFIFFIAVIFFILGIFFFSYAPTIFFQLKSIIFSIGSILCSALFLIFVVYKKINHTIVKIFSILPFSTLLFFMIFGLEKWNFFLFDLHSLSILKSQNPLIAVTLVLILFLKKKILKTVVVVSFILLFLLISFIQTKRCEKTSHLTYTQYIPFEIFFAGDYCLLEEKDGIYLEVPSDGKDEIFYKFSIPEKISKNQADLSFFKKTISKSQFPVIFSNEEVFAIFDLEKKFLGETQKIIFDQNLNPISIDGPLF